MSKVLDAAHFPVRCVIMPGRNGEDSRVVELELPDDQLFSGEKRKPVVPAVLGNSFIMDHFDRMNYDERVQVTEFIRLVVSLTPFELSRRWRRDPSLRIVEFYRNTFKQARWRYCSSRIYAGCVTGHDTSPRPLAGMFFGLGLGAHIEPSLSAFKSFRRGNAIAACKVHRDENVLLIWDFARAMDCPVMANLLTRSGAGHR